MRLFNQAELRVPVDAEGDLTIRYPDRRFATRLEPAGPAICTRCHAYLEEDHWLYSEKRYRELQALPDIHQMLCPGCTRVERRLYEGEVLITHNLDDVAKGDMLNLIHNEEARARATNPSSRIALLEDRGDQIYLLTTTQFLAKRIGLEIKKAFHGALTLSPLPRERFTRVRWTQGSSKGK